MSHSDNIIALTPGSLPDAQKLPEATGKKIVTIAAVAAVAGVALSALAAFTDVDRFAYSYLTGFAFTVTIAVGALFFVMLQHLTKAGWSVAARRQMEWIAGALPVCLLLFLPLIFLGSHIYKEWWAGAEVLKDELLAKKEGWLNPKMWIGRGLFFLAIWSVLGWWFSKTSERQDESGDPRLTEKMQNMSAPMMLIFALSLSFAGFDWLMSLQPHWYSTIFGVYTFAGSFVSQLAVLALMTLALQTSGLYKRVSNVEHRHDIGKLCFAFTVFWAYIAFAQFMLIYYANLPEETIFYRNRWVGSWSAVSLLLAAGQFAFPFLFLMSRHTKRNTAGLTIGASVILVMHYVDMYWLIMPLQNEHSAMPSWIDLAGLLAPAGILALAVALRATRTNMYPLKDPRLAETLLVENL